MTHYAFKCGRYIHNCLTHQYLTRGACEKNGREMYEHVYRFMAGSEVDALAYAYKCRTLQTQRDGVLEGPNGIQRI